MRKISFLLLAVSLISCEQRTVEKSITSRRLSEWKHPNLVSVDLHEIAFEKAFDEISEKSGVRVLGRSDRERVSLKCEKVPFWEAISRLSMSAQVPFIVNRKGEVEFGGVLNLERPLCEKWQLIGPFLVSGTNELEDGKRYVGVRFTCLPNEGTISRQGFYNVVVTSENSEKHQLPRKDSTPNAASPSWIVPMKFRDKSFEISGEVFCEIFSGLKSFDVNLVKAKTDFPDFFKMSIVTHEKKHEPSESFVEFSVNWESGLTAEGKKELDVIVDEIKQAVDEIKQAKGPDRYEVVDVKLWRWLESNSDKYRLLHVMKVELFDDQGKEIAITEQYEDTFDIFRPTKVKVVYNKGRAPANLRISVCERIPVIACFSLPVSKL